MPRSKSTKKIVINISSYEKKIIDESAKKAGYRYTATYVKKIIKDVIKKKQYFQ